uniref:Uncharacterized protein n=3 Tax=Oryza TaxID=4527 RepID=A0A0D3FMK1_9ORYZ
MHTKEFIDGKHCLAGDKDLEEVSNSVVIRRHYGNQRRVRREGSAGNKAATKGQEEAFSKS